MLGRWDSLLASEAFPDRGELEKLAGECLSAVSKCEAMYQRMVVSEYLTKGTGDPGHARPGDARAPADLHAAGGGEIALEQVERAATLTVEHALVVLTPYILLLEFRNYIPEHRMQYYLVLVSIPFRYHD